MRPREFLMIPGPTPVPDAVLEAAARHPLGHRSAEFSQELRLAVNDLKWLGQAERDPLILTSSGTGAMEAAIANTINAGDKVLSLVCGVFGERWAKIAEAYRAEVQRLVVEPGEAVSVERVADVLKAYAPGDLKAVTVTHNETSTGVLNDLASIAELARQRGALSIVDAVTSFGACPVPIDSWGLDVVVTGSQKALMLPPGLAFVFVGERAWKAHEKCTTPRFYFDFGKYRKSLGDDTTPFTPNVSLVVALRRSLVMLKESGREAVFARHAKMRDSLRAGVRAMGLRLLVADEHASPTITSILPPEGVTVDAIRSGLKERFRIVVADGQESLKGKIFRIGHMGYMFERDILMTLSSLEAVLTSLGYRCPPGKAVSEAIALL